MKTQLFESLSSLQKIIMESVWESGEITVYGVLDRISPDRKMPYTTVLSAMQKLSRTSWLKFRIEGRTYNYTAARTKEQEGYVSLQKLIDQIFQGDPLLLFQHFIRKQNLSKEDLAQLQKMINQKRKEVSNE